MYWAEARKRDCRRFGKVMLMACLARRCRGVERRRRRGCMIGGGGSESPSVPCRGELVVVWDLISSRAGDADGCGTLSGHLRIRQEYCYSRRCIFRRALDDVDGMISGEFVLLRISNLFVRDVMKGIYIDFKSLKTTRNIIPPNQAPSLFLTTFYMHIPSTLGRLTNSPSQP